MAINFPDSPELNETLTIGDRTWTWNGSAWRLSSYGVQGPQGLTGVEIDATPPSDTSIMWVDTGEQGSAVLPYGGSNGQILAKASNSDFDTEWISGPKIINTDGDPGNTIYVGSVDPDGVYTLAAGDIWIEPSA